MPAADEQAGPREEERQLADPRILGSKEGFERHVLLRQLLGRVKLANSEQIIPTYWAQLVSAKRYHCLSATRGRDKLNLNGLSRINLHHSSNVALL